MLDKIIITLTEEEINSNPIFHGFYPMVARQLGYTETDKTTYNCTKICVAQNIQDKCFEYYERLGNDSADIAMNLCLAGPKVDKGLKNYQVAIEEGYISEGEAIVKFTANCAIPPHQEKSVDLTDKSESGKGMNEYTVQIILSELTIVAESPERAEEIAIGIYESDARTHLTHGLCIEACEVEEQGPSCEDEETEV